MGVRWPRTVFASGGNYAFQDNHEWPNTFSGTMEFGPGPVARHGFVLQYTMRTGCRRETRSHGKCFLGSSASMLLDRSGYSIVKEFPRGQKVMSTEALISPEETVRPANDDMYHVQVFLDNLRARKQPWQLGRSIRWDGENNRIVGDPAANALVMKPYRAPWKLEV